MNFVTATVAGGGTRLAAAGRLGCRCRRAHRAALAGKDGQEVVVGVRPENVLPPGRGRRAARPRRCPSPSRSPSRSATRWWSTPAPARTRWSSSRTRTAPPPSGARRRGPARARRPPPLRRHHRAPPRRLTAADTAKEHAHAHPRPPHRPRRAGGAPRRLAPRTWWSGTPTAAPRRPPSRRWSPAYNARPTTKVKVSPLAVPFDAFADKISAAVPRGKGPDVFIYAQDRMGGWIEAGNTVEPIDFFVDDALKARFIPTTIQALTYRGSLWGAAVQLQGHHPHLQQEAPADARRPPPPSWCSRPRSSPTRRPAASAWPGPTATSTTWPRSSTASAAASSARATSRPWTRRRTSRRSSSSSSGSRPASCRPSRRARSSPRSSTRGRRPWSSPARGSSARSPRASTTAWPRCRPSARAAASRCAPG